MSSMSVHSLIDKFSNKEEDTTSTSRPQSSTGRLNRNMSSPQKSPTKPHSEPQALSEPWDYRDKARTIPNSEEESSRQEQTESKPDNEQIVPTAVAVSFLGPDVKDFPMSVSTFNSALLLRAEQERSRQESLRLEIASRNLAILEAGAKSEVPPHLIPSMCVGGIPETPKPQGHVPPYSMHQPTNIRHKSGDLGPTYWPPSAPPSAQASPFLGPSSSLATREQLENANPVAPINYRFGGGPNKTASTPQHGHRRSRSPAKIGAAAVASLANPVTPYRPVQRTLPLHQRHFSMPTDPMNRYQAGIDSQATQRGADRSKSKPPPQQSVLQSPMGGTSSMQVRPTPALPLHKQTKSSQVPSQESMSSFQHVIQFHHWKPENPGAERMDKPEKRGSVSTFQPPAPYSHKRHKSHDMSIDLSHDMSHPANRGESNLSPHIPAKEDADVSMEISDAAANEDKSDAHDNKIPRTENNNRFPRNILSTGES